IDEAAEARFVIVSTSDALNQGGKIESDQVYLDSNLRKVLLDHGEHLLAGFVTGIGDDRKFDAISRGIAQSSSFEPEPCPGKQLKRSRGIVLRRRKRRIEPETIGRGNGTESRMSVTTKNDAAQIGAIDGHGNGFAKFRGAEPVLLVFGERGGRHLVEPHEFGIEARASIVSDRGCFFLQAVEVFGVKSVDQMNFAATEAKQFNVAIPLNIEPNRIEIGQRLSLFVLFPVIRIPAEKHMGAGAVIRDVEGSQNGHLLLRRMRGENGDLIKKALESRYWRGKSDDHSVG